MKYDELAIYGKPSFWLHYHHQQKHCTESTDSKNFQIPCLAKDLTFLEHFVQITNFPWF